MQAAERLHLFRFDSRVRFGLGRFGVLLQAPRTLSFFFFFVTTYNDFSFSYCFDSAKLQRRLRPTALSINIQNTMKGVQRQVTNSTQSGRGQ